MRTVVIDHVAAAPHIKRYDEEIYCQRLVLNKHQ